MAIEEETFLSVEAAAERLAISRSVAYRMVERGRSGLDGGWPPGTWLVTTPGQERQLVRIRWERLLQHLEQISVPAATPATAKCALAAVL
jgi:hypothetical protein